MLPPPLAWLTVFGNSIGLALGSPVALSAKPTVNPLVYAITISFAEAPSGRNLMHIWNLFQIFAHLNDSVPHGKNDSDDKKVIYSVIIKRRFGLPRDSHPLE